MTDYLEGILTRAQENDPLPHLQLEREILNSGHPLDVLIQGHWIAGHIETYWTGNKRVWYLATNEDTDPVIVLDPGIRARIRA